MNLQLFALNNYNVKFMNDGGSKAVIKDDEDKSQIPTVKGTLKDIATGITTGGLGAVGATGNSNKGVNSATDGILAGANMATGGGKTGGSNTGGSNAGGSGKGSGGTSGADAKVPETQEPIAGTPSVAEVNPILEGILNNSFTQSDRSKENDALANELLSKLMSMPAPSAGFSATQFKESQAYQDAMKFTNELLAKLSSGKTSYTDQIKDMMDKIMSREKFSYNVDDDTLFQQALASAMGDGRQAMQDTIGQASALTGGYASSYATSAGNQAYNAFIEDAYDNLPEYYRMAMDAYQMEGDELYNQLNMLNQADATEYQRLYDSWNANFTNAQTMYDHEYNYWRDSNDFAYKGASLSLEAQGMAYNQALNTYNAIAGYGDTLYNREYQQWYDKTALGLDAYQNYLDNEYRYDVMENDNIQAGLDRDFKAGESEKERGFEAGESEKDREFTADENAKDRNARNSNNSATPDVTGTGIDQKHYNGAIEAYETGGIDGLNRYLNSLGGTYSDSQLDVIGDYVGQYGNYTDPNDPENPVPYSDREWKFSKDGGGKIGDLNDDAEIKDQYGNTISIEALYKALQDEGMSPKKAKEYIIALQEELGI